MLIRRPAAWIWLSFLVLGACSNSADWRGPEGEIEPQSVTGGETTPSYPEAIQAIARDIEDQKGEFPQLAEFSASANCDPKRLVIRYGYRTHESRSQGGWTAGVPSPEEDGVWLYIDFHEPGSMAQIHTQPVVLDRRYRDKRVMFLILEGTRTKRLEETLKGILSKHGVRSGG